MRVYHCKFWFVKLQQHHFEKQWPFWDTTWRNYKQWESEQSWARQLPSAVQLRWVKVGSHQAVKEADNLMFFFQTSLSLKLCFLFLFGSIWSVFKHQLGQRHDLPKDCDSIEQQAGFKPAVQAKEFEPATAPNAPFFDYMSMSRVYSFTFSYLSLSLSPKIE